MRKILVAGLIIKDDKVLLVHNIKYALRVEPPGGKRKEGETSEDAVKRELQEELGIEIEPISKFGTYDTESPEGQFSVEMFICKITKGEPKTQKAEEGKIDHFEWYTFDQIEEMKQTGILAPNLCEALPKLRERYEQKFKVK